MILWGSSDSGAIENLKFLEEKLYEFKFIKINKLVQLKKIKHDKISLIITGSAIGNSLDKKLINFSKSNKIKSISIIEHWTNYKKRFLLNKKYIYPDFIFLNDKQAYNNALKKGLPKNKLIIAGNPYLSNFSNKKIMGGKIRKKFDNLRKKKVYLFLSENISSQNNNQIENYKIDEFLAVKKITKYLKKNEYLIIKLHPEEKLNKFDKLKKKNVIITKNMNYSEMVKLPKYIIGLKTIMLIKLAAQRKNIISLLNNNNKTFIEDFFLKKKIKKDMKFFFNKTDTIKKFRNKINQVLND